MRPPVTLPVKVVREARVSTIADANGDQFATVAGADHFERATFAAMAMNSTSGGPRLDAFRRRYPVEGEF